jgi:hypothetical protein
MAKENHSPDGKKPGDKKKVRKQIITVMESNLPVLKEGLSDKKLHRNIKKAAKVLMDGFSAKAKEAAAKTARPKPAASKPVGIKSKGRPSKS